MKTRTRQGRGGCQTCPRLSADIQPLSSTACKRGVHHPNPPGNPWQPQGAESKCHPWGRCTSGTAILFFDGHWERKVLFCWWWTGSLSLLSTERASCCPVSRVRAEVAQSARSLIKAHCAVQTKITPGASGQKKLGFSFRVSPCKRRVRLVSDQVGTCKKSLSPCPLGC